MFDDEKLGYPKYEDECKSIIEKFLTLCLPVTTTPCAKIGKIKTECCGNPIISSMKHDVYCDEMKDGCCKFTIIQKMKVEIPIDFEADTKIDDLFVDCEFKNDKYDHDKHDKHMHDYDKKDCDKLDC